MRTTRSALPSLVVFDLDFTLWDCGGTWCDCLTPPFHQTKHGIHDRQGRSIRLYDDVHQILNLCEADAIPMALASRTEQPIWAVELVQRLGIEHRFHFAEIYPTSKLKHFARLQQASDTPYRMMLFFDDEMRNIREVSTLGVHCVHVENGMTLPLFQKALQRFVS